ncbi:transposable element Tcb2 transposase [Trichonephila clavipes]|nr:transposable element Tcb2 transposase [Trichonephila clavipes]
MEDPICYELRVISIATGTSVTCYSPKSFLSLQGIPRAIFQQVNARPHVAKTVPDFCSAQHMQLLPWPVYSADASSIKHVLDLVGGRLARDPRSEASKDELMMRIQAIWNSLP